MLQQSLFSKNTIQQINVYHQAPQSESKTDSLTMKLTPTQKEALKNIARERNIGASSFIQEAMDIYIHIYPFREKLQRHHDLLINLLSSLP